MATIKKIQTIIIWISLILIFIAAIALFYKNVLVTVICLFIAAIIYIFKKDISKMIKE